MSFRHTRLALKGAIGKGAIGVSLLGLLVPVTPAFAQDAEAEIRIRKLEAEVRALQRRVFPGGDGRFFEPQIDSSGAGTPNSIQPTTSTSAVTDILARLDAMEVSMQRLTSQVEENSNAIAGMNTRLAALDGGAAPQTAAATPVSAAPETGATNLLPSGGGTTGATRTVATPAPTPEPAATGPSAQRLAAVQAITKPQSDDAADDEYSYGFRLWNAGFYPEAQQQLAMFVERYPSHWRTTYGRNLLGRAYLDDGKARDAAPWFLQNYQADRNAARAPDSLLYLAQSMIELEDTNRACIALAEFGESYPALAAGRLQSKYEASRQKVTCSN